METTDEILAQLNELLPNGQWRAILTTLAITGLADGLQLQQASNLDHNQLRRTLEKMEQVAAGEKPLFRIITGKLQRASLQGRAPKVYQLAEGGASLLHHLGYEQAHASQQTSAIARAHALDVLNVHLAAVRANLPVLTEKILRANEQTFIRPDCLVTLSDGQQVIFEVEQVARPDYLPRMSESLQNKLAFFKAGGQVSRILRVVFNLRPGKELEQTMSRWQGLTHLLRQENGGSLPFALFGMSIVDFIDNPDWSPTPDPTRWRNLTEPLPESRMVETRPSVPALPPFSSKQNVLLLQAQLQWLNENKTNHHQSKFPDPGFFEVMEIIYLASYKSNATPLERAAFPQASIYLLGQYLASNPELREALNPAITRGGAGAFWNVHYVQQRMQQVIDIFLEYHGFRSDGALRAIPVTVDWNALQPKSFAVQVKIETAEILPSTEYGSARNRIDGAENALAWVLRALFVHAARIGLKTPKFW
jgi:hypothetical protein